MILVPRQSELTEVPKSERRSAPAGQCSGVLISQPLEGGPAQHHDVVTCVHCQRAWVWHSGSGRRRGWCTRCNGITCGSDACDLCVPAEQMLAAMAAGMTFEEARAFRPVVAAVPRSVGG